MSAPGTIDSVESAAAYLEDRYGPHIAALLAYGSRVFGHARRGSAYDFWLIVKDPLAFHDGNAEFYRTELNRPSTPEQQAGLNRAGPIFYSISVEDAEIKIAVIGEDDFVRLCHDWWWTVKGRMQKPVRAVCSSPGVDAAILATRREALACGLNLVSPRFNMDELLIEIISLSYRAEVRPENKRAKARSILESGRTQLAAIYGPLLAEMSYVKRAGEGWEDLRGEVERRRGRDATLRALKRSKWSRRSLAFVWRNFCSHGSPVRYILLKVVGEIEKAFKSVFRRRRKAPTPRAE